MSDTISTNSTSTTSSPSQKCSQCGEVPSERDDWCAICGVALRGLSLSPARILVTDTTLRCEVELRATGVLPTTYAIARRHLVLAPKWISPQVEADVSRTISPGEVDVVTFEFSPVFLPQGRTEGEEPGHFSLPIAIASLARDDDGRARRATSELEFVSPSRARVRPAFSQTRLLPRQRIEHGQILAREVELENAGGHRTRLTRVYARDFALREEDAQRIERAGLDNDDSRRILARHLVVCPPLSAARNVDAAQRVQHPYAFKLAPDVLAKDAVGTFDVEIVFELQDRFAEGIPMRAREVTARVVGVVGAAPDVTLVDGAPVPVRTHGARTLLQVRLRNPGAAAVTVSHITFEDPAAPSDATRKNTDDDSAENNADDWVRPAQVWRAPVTIDAFSERVLELIIDPDRRLGAALNNAWGERRITLHHDGWQDADARFLSFHLSAELGEVTTLKGAVVGIDFGTSSSAVSLLHGESGRAFALPLEPELARDELPSVLFYQGGEPPFLYGTEAENAAPLAFSNVVRSIKSVVAKDPDLKWSFLERRAADAGAASGGASRLRTFQSTELLARFLVEVKRRGEQGTRKLPHDFLDALDLTGRGVRLSRAVFTHPVDTSLEALRALYAAAKAAALCDDALAFDEFVADACLDEALAAVLAFVFVAAKSSGGAAAPLLASNAFTLLSVDVGGGTSDLALVTVRDLSSFLSGQAQTVEVELIASGGCPRLGGDDFDRVIAEYLIERVGQTQVGKSLDLAGVRRAVSHPSYESFRRASSSASSSGSARASSDASLALAQTQETHLHKLWAAASSLLRLSEEKKRMLSTQGQVQVRPLLTDWPGTQAFADQQRQLEVTLTRKDAVEIYAPMLSRLSSSALALLRDAGVTPGEIAAILFTGKGCRLPEVTACVIDAVRVGRVATDAIDDASSDIDDDSNGMNAPLALLPGSIPDFDEKRCVATGAAVWGDSRGHGGGWLRIRRRSSNKLDATYALRRGPRFIDIEGLRAGATLPARGRIQFGAPTKTVVVYRQAKVAFTFELDVAVTEVEIEIVNSREAIAVTPAGRFLST